MIDQLRHLNPSQAGLTLLVVCIISRLVIGTALQVQMLLHKEQEHKLAKQSRYAKIQKL